jgi:ABC-type transport system involved in multi-copper enzyme maturation permease subunit
MASTVFTAAEARRANAGLANLTRSEWTKLWSLRSTIWTLLATIVLTTGASTLAAWGQTGHLKPGEVYDPTNFAMGGLVIGQLAIAVLGVLIVTSEYSTGGVRVTYTAAPGRLRVLTAKGIVLAAVSIVVGMITAFGAFYATMPFWAHHGLAAHIGDPGVLRAIIGGGLYVLASAMFGFAIGAIIRHTAAAITAVVGLLFVLPPLSQLLPGKWGEQVANHFTSNAGQHITDVINGPGHLSPWAGYLTFTLEWMLPLLLGAWLIQRRDA